MVSSSHTGAIFCAWIVVVMVTMTTVNCDPVTHQMLELMPRSEWNVQEHSYARVEQLYGTDELPHHEKIKKIIENAVYDDSLRYTENDQVGDTSFGENFDDDDFDDINDADSDFIPVIRRNLEIEHYKVDNFDTDAFAPKLHVPFFKDALVSMVRTAFNNHQPFILTPDLVYAYLAKGIALHINKYPEELRYLFVNHAGKEKLTYRNDNFIKGSVDNDWGDAFHNFADQLKEKTNGSSIVQNDLSFSTSTPINEAHRHVLAMESMRSYFDYEVLTMCGISAVILEGTLEDWLLLQQTIISQLRDINEYAMHNKFAKEATLDWWSPAVDFMLDKIVTTYQTLHQGGTLSSDLKIWWSTIYKYNAAWESGEVSKVTGWINTFYPYVGSESIRNSWLVGDSPFTKYRPVYFKKINSFFLEQKRKFDPNGPMDMIKFAVEEDAFISYAASVPFTWTYHKDVYNMTALIGYSVLGEVTSDKYYYPVGTLKIFPSWAIYYRP